MSRDTSVSSHEGDEDPWRALQIHYDFVYRSLYFESRFVRKLYGGDIVSREDMELLLSHSLTRAEKAQRLLLEILPSRPPEMFLVLCNVFREVGQPHVADRLTQKTASSQGIVVRESRSTRLSCLLITK